MAATISPSRSTVIAVSLAIALAVNPAQPALADNMGTISTSSVRWHSADSTTGVFTGGTPETFDPAHGGWRGAAFGSIGQFGIEQTVGSQPTTRNSFSAWNEATTIEQGGTTTLNLSAQIITDSVTRNTANPIITASGNFLRYQIAIREFWAGSLSNKRVFFFADLAAGPNVRYENLAPSTLLATDSDDTTPDVLLHIQATAGNVSWGSRTNHTAPLVDGDPLATGYVANMPSTGTDITVYAVVIDGDPCASEEMRDLAVQVGSNLAGHFGEALEIPSSCLVENSWEIVTSAESAQLVPLSLSSRVVTPDGSTRRFAIGGEPESVEASVDYTSDPPSVRFDLTGTPTPGTSALTLTSWLETGTTRSQPMSQLVSFSLVEPQPEPTPPPEPEPEPEFEPEVIPELEPEPVVSPEPEAEPTPEPPVVATSSPERNRDDDDFVEVVGTPIAPSSPLPPRPSTTTDKEVTPVPEGDYRLQESTPATPLPAPPPPESVRGLAHEPATTIWTTWWLWVILGLSLIWWAWLGWYSRKDTSEKGM